MAEAIKEGNPDGSGAIDRMRFIPPAESEDDRKVRIETEKWQQATTAAIGESFKENQRRQPTTPAQKNTREQTEFEEFPDDHTPAVAAHLRANKPSKVGEGM
eukprot:gene16244-19278_t